MNTRAPHLAPPIVASLLLAGCLVGNQPAPDDPDSDFLVSADEEAGWTIRVFSKAATCFTNETVEPQILNVTSNPHEFDTDFDGVPDDEEASFGANPRAVDTDSDGLTDAEELRLNREHQVELPGGLKLFKADSDGDCLLDSLEVNGTEVAGVGYVTSDPTTADTDHDGLTDPREILQVRSNPRKNDTDDDGAGDAIDVDPRNDVTLDVTFLRFRLKEGSDDLRFQWSIETPEGRYAAPEDMGSFSAGSGTAADVPGEQSPGLVDVEDETASSFLQFEFWVVRTSTGEPIALTPSGEYIVTARVNPVEGTWSIETLTGAADGTAHTMESSAAWLEFSFAVGAR